MRRRARSPKCVEAGEPALADRTLLIQKIQYQEKMGARMVATGAVCASGRHRSQRRRHDCAADDHEPGRHFPDRERQEGNEPNPEVARVVDGARPDRRIQADSSVIASIAWSSPPRSAIYA